MSNITVVGQLSDDVELRYTSGGQALANFRVGEPPPYAGKGAEQKGSWTNFNNCEAWGTLAENMASSFAKGDKVILVGRMETQKYEHDGKDREKLVFRVEDAAPALRFATVMVERNARVDK